jgi:LysM repeat protein/predicted nucleic acid-binding Zn ribbon protein
LAFSETPGAARRVGFEYNDRAGDLSSGKKQMPEDERLASDVIQAYRRRRQRMVPFLLGALAVVLLVVGIFLVVIWFTGDNPPQIPEVLRQDTETPEPSHTPQPPTQSPIPSDTPEPSLTPTPSGPISYIVEEGDSLSSIADQFQVTIDVLIAANNLEDPNNIGVGTELIIPDPDSELPTGTPLPETLLPGSTIEYDVKTGDTLQSIADQFNSTVEAIAEANDLDPTEVLFVGLKLIVPVEIVTPVPTNTPSPFTPTPTPQP